MKHFTFLLTAVLLSTASLTACSEESMSIQERTEQRFKLNPNPQEAYRIRIKINDAPGPLKLMRDMTIRYAARNCSYVINKFEGATTEPTKRIKAPTRQIGQDEYEALFYFDAVQDEDYFGEGVCKWKPDGFGAAFRATGKPEETVFNFSDVMEELTKQNILTKYYWNGAYPYLKKEDGSPDLFSDGSAFTDFGEPLHNFSLERQKDLFSITVTLEKVK